VAKTRLNTEEAFKSIMGKTAEPSARKTESEKMVKEKFMQTAFYITKKQHRALKIKAALGDNPEEKDQSSIVRAALNAYLADTLTTLQ